MPRRHSFALFSALVLVVLYCIGCSSTSSLLIIGAFAPNGTVGTPYAGNSVTASGGSGTYAWTVTGLPPGVTASGASTATLTLSGTPTTVGAYTVGSTVTDFKGRTATYTTTITISSSATLTINGTLTLTGSVGAAYSGTLTATGGTAPYMWTITNLPNGVTFSGDTTATLAVSGMPTASGSYQVNVTLADSAGGSAKSSATVTISSAAALAITGSLPATGSVGAAYSGTLTAVNGTSPYVWTVSGLPTGVSVTAGTSSTPTVDISGTPTTAATYTVSALVTDSKNATALYTVTVVVGAGQASASDVCASTAVPLGNESALSRPFAFVLDGYDANHFPVSWAGSATPDGKGRVVVADVDEISETNGPASYKVDLAGSAYTLDSAGNGCLYFTFNGTNTSEGAAAKHWPNPALGGGAKAFTPSRISENAMPIRNVEFHFVVGSQTLGGEIAIASGDKRFSASGRIFEQDASAFATAKLSSRFAFGLSGWYLAGENQVERTAMAGRISLAPRSGVLPTSAIRCLSSPTRAGRLIPRISEGGSGRLRTCGRWRSRISKARRRPSSTWRRRSEPLRRPRRASGAGQGPPDGADQSRSWLSARWLASASGRPRTSLRDRTISVA